MNFNEQKILASGGELTLGNAYLKEHGYQGGPVTAYDPGPGAMLPIEGGMRRMGVERALNGIFAAIRAGIRAITGDN